MARCSIASRFLRSIVFDNDVLDDQYEHVLLACIEAYNLANKGRTSRRRGFVEGRVVVPCNIAQGGRNLYQDYFNDPLVFPGHLFWRRFRMSHNIVLLLKNALKNCDPLFIQQRECHWTFWLSSLQKITAALRMFAYGNVTDNVHEYVRIGESTALESLKRFVKAVVATFGDEYLRLPNNNDIARLLAIEEQQGFSGMLGSIDCMHWRWKNYPYA